MKRRAGIGGVLLALVGAVAVAALVVGGCAYSGYNRAIGLDERVDADWAQVENVLQRRYDLIPNLVETVKGYAGHEKEIFEAVAESRTKYFAAGNREEKIEAANGLERALSRLLVLKETYPELKAQTSFLSLQDELAGTENRIAVERKRYNDAVRELNAYVRQFPGRIFAGWAGVEQAKYFEVAEEAKAAPKVNFGTE
jgi:LemA protein